MKSQLKKLVRLLPAPVLNSLDSLLVHDRLRRRLLALQGNHKINFVYDVGAHIGEWSTQVAQWRPKAKFFLFEANPKHEPALIESGFDYVIALLSSHVESKDFFATGGTGDSYFKELTSAYDNVKPSLLRSSTLDDVAKVAGFHSPDLVKIDTQGSELDVIAGGAKSLTSARFVLLECPVQKYNLGAPSFVDYVEKMTTLGFYPDSVVEYHVREGSLIQMDLLFVAADATPIDSGT